MPPTVRKTPIPKPVGPKVRVNTTHTKTSVRGHKGPGRRAAVERVAEGNKGIHEAEREQGRKNGAIDRGQKAEREVGCNRATGTKHGTREKLHEKYEGGRTETRPRLFDEPTVPNDDARR